MEVFQTVVALIVTLGILVTFHEYGHYWVARRCGVKVLRFSVGFGKPLWGWKGKDGTEYVVAAIPLGGYVKFLDEREAPVPEDQLDQAFNRKPVLQRIAIVAAGPVPPLAHPKRTSPNRRRWQTGSWPPDRRQQSQSAAVQVYG